MLNSKSEKKRAYLIEEGGDKKYVELITVHGLEELDAIEGQWDKLDSEEGTPK